MKQAWLRRYGPHIHAGRISLHAMAAALLDQRGALVPFLRFRRVIIFIDTKD